MMRWHYCAGLLVAAGVFGLGGNLSAGETATGTTTPLVTYFPEPAEIGVGDADLAVPSGFGTADSDLSVIPWSSFFPRDSADGYQAGGGTVRRYSPGTPWMYAAITNGDVPNGADISQIAFYIHDTGPGDFAGGLCAWYADSGDGSDYNADCSTPATNSGFTGGDTIVFYDPDLTMQRRYDYTGDMSTEVVAWTLITSFGATDGTMRIGFARIVWKRQISPAPMSATFNDVPTSHWSFQNVEALADSGITVGCGGGNFCPQEPVTRAEMAAFLARALGLHWPSGLGF